MINRHHDDTRPLYVEPPDGPEAAVWPPATPTPARDAPWCGAFTAFSVGDPGRAATSVRPIPDPDLWNQRDTVVDGLTIRNQADREVLQLRAASVRGLSHRYYGKVRQDDYAFRQSADGRYLVAVVADGVSAGKYSHHAASIVTTQGCDALAGWLPGKRPEHIDWAELLHHLGTAVTNAGRRLVRRHHPEVDLDSLNTRDLARYLAATALFAVIELPTDGVEMPAHVFAYGDTSAWVLRDGSRWESQQPVKNQGSAIASSGTRAIPLVPQEIGVATRITLRAGDALALLTDGIGDPLGSGSGEVGAFLATVWARPPAALEFAAQVDFARKSFDDDRTAVVLWPRIDT